MPSSKDQRNLHLSDGKAMILKGNSQRTRVCPEVKSVGAETENSVEELKGKTGNLPVEQKDKRGEKSTSSGESCLGRGGIIVNYQN